MAEPRPRQGHHERASGERTAQVLTAARTPDMGLGQMSQVEVDTRFASLTQQLTTGIMGEGSLRLQAIKTHVSPIPAAAWSKVPSGEGAIIGEFGGETLRVKVARKQNNGLVAVSGTVHEETFGRDERQVPFGVFVDRLARPLADNAAELGDLSQPIKVGLSLGLPHENVDGKDGIQVHLHPEEGGYLGAKEQVIVDWESIPEGEREIMHAISKRMGEFRPGLRVKTKVGINDTPGVLLDAGAAQQARELGLAVSNTGSVNGTGTNNSFDLQPGHHPVFGIEVPQQDAGLINTEVGHGRVPDNRVSRRMRQRLLEKGEMQPVQDRPEVEHELGQYLPLRLAAGVELLAEDGVLPVQNPRELAEQIIAESKRNKTLMDDLALGTIRLTPDADINSAFKTMAQEVMGRAGQMYGTLFAMAGEGAHPETSEQLRAYLTEGSVLLKGKIDTGKTVKDKAAETAETLGVNIVPFPADGAAGVAALTMAHEHMDRRAA